MASEFPGGHPGAAKMRRLSPLGRSPAVLLDPGGTRPARGTRSRAPRPSPLGPRTPTPGSHRAGLPQVPLVTPYLTLSLSVSSIKVKFLEVIKPFCVILPEIQKPERKVSPQMVVKEALQNWALGVYSTIKNGLSTPSGNWPYGV